MEKFFVLIVLVSYVYGQIVSTPIHKVIIIGAGISGVGASKTLYSNNIEHIILQSRNRTGGRLKTQQFDGVNVDLGASFVHEPLANNSIAQIVSQLKWATISANYDSQEYFYQNVGQIDDDKIIDQTSSAFQDWLTNIYQVADNSPKDISYQQAGVSYFQNQISTQSKQYQDLVRWNMDSFIGTVGGLYNKMSAKDPTEDIQTPQDYLPSKGYTALLQAILNAYDPTFNQNVVLNKQVVEIDYSGDVVKVKTHDNSVYYANQVVSSLPLGVLKHNLVTFNPPLPQEYQTAIQNIGLGLLNKIYVSFKTPFWDITQTWINFVSKGENKYPIAMSIVQNGHYILLFFVSAQTSSETEDMSDQQIVDDLVSYIQNFVSNPIQVVNYLLTHWEKDENAFGSYSYYQLGTTNEDFQTLNTPIDNKLWFIGEHTNPIINSCVHSAFQTGIWAGQNVSQLYPQGR